VSRRQLRIASITTFVVIGFLALAIIGGSSNEFLRVIFVGPLGVSSLFWLVAAIVILAWTDRRERRQGGG
jgi:hypothetical protein